MSDRVTIGLDNPAFYGRLRQPSLMWLSTRTRPNNQLLRRPHARHSENISDVQVVERPKHSQPIPVQQSINRYTPLPQSPIDHTPVVQPMATPVWPEPYTPPAQPTQQPSRVPRHLAVILPSRRNKRSKSVKVVYRPTKLQLGLIGMAMVVFVLGVFSSLETIKTNHDAANQVAALSRKANPSVVPSDTKPSSSAFSNYAVAPNYPKYLKIPALGVDTRVLQVGVTKGGALGTPPNVYDTAWYTGSAEPGQPGAVLIDGHVSSWTAHGVFYGLKTLEPGDAIQIVRGNNAVFNYQVVKTQIYGANNVNMQAAITPITPGVPGLNLITCTGDVIRGTSLFNERIIVFAKQV